MSANRTTETTRKRESGRHRSSAWKTSADFSVTTVFVRFAWAQFPRALARSLSRRLAAKVKERNLVVQTNRSYFGKLTHIFPACAVPKNAHGLINNNRFKVRILAT